MTWHLKDRELQKKLIAIDYKFLDNLNDAVKEKIEEFSSDLIEEGDLITLMFCRDHQIELGELYFLFHELEEVPEYNPNAWNEYPAVTPPCGVLMRLEFTETESTGKPKRHYVAATFNGITWGTCDSYSANFKITNCRFRPWED